MKEKIEVLVNQILDDISTLRETKTDASERIGAEIMALNAVVNATAFLKE